MLWSLSIEETFYLVFPLSCILLLRRRRWGTAAWILLGLALAAMGPFARTAWNAADLARENSYLAGMASIALGCLTAYATEWLRRQARFAARLPRLAQIAQLAGWGIVALLCISPRWKLLHFLGRTGLDDTALALGACLLMVGATLRPAAAPRWMLPPPLVRQALL